MEIIKTIIVMMICFSGGLVISGAVFAFIAIIGVVPSLAYKTNTVKYIKLYEEVIIFGGIFAALSAIFNMYIPLNIILIVFYSFSIGVFYGVLASSLAEVLDVIPIMTRRLNIQKGIYWFLISIGFGKLIGSILYFVNTNFQI